MEYLLISAVIGLLMAKATDTMAPGGLGGRLWVTIIAFWPLILLVLAIKGRTHETEDEGR